MKKLVKGSKAAKDFMAKIRAKRKTKKAPKKTAIKKAVVKKAAPKKAAAKKIKIKSLNINVIDEIRYRLGRINKLQNEVEFLTDLIKTANPIAKKAIKADIIFCKKMIRDFKLQNNKLKKLIK